MVPSSATRKLPVPLPSDFAGGTSSAGARLTLIAPEPGIQSGILSRKPAHPASATTATTATMLLICCPPLDVEPTQNETGWRLEYSHARHRRLVRPFAPAHSRLYARARGTDVRQAVRRFRRRRHQDRVAAGGGSERKHGRPARRPGH